MVYKAIHITRSHIAMQQQQMDLYPLTDDDFSDVEKCKSGLAVVNMEVACLHNPQSKLHQSVVRNIAFNHIGTMSLENREKLMSSIKDGRATPMIDKVNAVVAADKCFKNEKLPADFVACLDRLDAMKDEKTRLIEELEADIEAIASAHAYITELKETKNVVDSVENAFREPLIESRKRNRA